MKVGKFIDECDAIEKMIAKVLSKELATTKRVMLESKIIVRVNKLITKGYRIPKPSWNGLGLCLVLLFSLCGFAQLPNRRLTPGAVRTTNAREICATSFRTGPYRHTSHAMKRHVCEAYGVKRCPVYGRMEIDHLIPLELGGRDEERNLWVQFAKYADGSPGFHVKDVLENELRRRVCSRQMRLQDAQKCLVRSWVSCYERVLGVKP